MHREPHTAEPDTGWSVGKLEPVAVLGATSYVGRLLLDRLEAAALAGPGSSAVDRRLFAFSRAAGPATNGRRHARWHRLPTNHATWQEAIPHWIAVCPLWAVEEHFPLLEAAGARRLVALSSTSRLTRRGSTASTDRALAARLGAAEETVIAWARARGIVPTIFRPTMIYDGVHDRNVAAVAGFIRRYGFFPVAGTARGLRQPVHVEDVASACQAALTHAGRCDTYELSGGETLSFRDMVDRIFAWLGRPPRVVAIPGGLVRTVAQLVGVLPGLGGLTATAVRMDEDMVFDHVPAARDFGFQPRPFSLPSGPPRHHAAGASDPVRLA